MKGCDSRVYGGAAVMWTWSMVTRFVPECSGASPAKHLTFSGIHSPDSELWAPTFAFGISVFISIYLQGLFHRHLCNHFVHVFTCRPSVLMGLLLKDHTVYRITLKTKKTKKQKTTLNYYFSICIYVRTFLLYS